MLETDRRLRGRVALRLPIVVTGAVEGGASWCEPSQTEDISPVGLSLRLLSGVRVGDILRLRGQTCGARETMEVDAVVIHATASPFGGTRAGISITGRTGNWLRFYDSWAEEASAPTEA